MSDGNPPLSAVSANPYGGGPGTGISLPPYFKPTANMKNNNVYYPEMEELGKDEMRISFVGSCPFPPRRDQAGTCIMVELGNGKRYFFDFGSGCLRNIVAMQVPIGLVNDIFLTHLHVDHYADIPYLLPFGAACGLRFKPLRVTGPSGRTPELGTKAMTENMRKMLRWHLEEFDTCPAGDGFEIEVNEFDFRNENEICYDKDGVTVRHWPRSHGKDGASAYRLDWNGLSFVWTGDGRPDELTLKYAKGVDVFVSEVQSDLGDLMSMKMGMPVELYNYVIDTHHTPHYAAGYMMQQIQPRIAMVTHIEHEPSLVSELVAGIRAHYKGLFVVGAPDVKVVNVTKEAIWVRDASLVDFGNPRKPKPADLLELALDTSRRVGHMLLPEVKQPRERQQDAYVREMEIDPAKYYPPDVKRDLILTMPEMSEMLGGKVKAKLGEKIDKIKAIFTHDEE
jgi:ribonuclease Z